MNNIIAISNSVFNYNHKLSFDQRTYDSIFRFGDVAGGKFMGMLHDEIQVIKVRVPRSPNDPDRIKKPVARRLMESAIDATHTREGLWGMGFTFQRDDLNYDEFTLHSDVAESVLPDIFHMLSEMGTDTLLDSELSFKFFPQAFVDWRYHSFTAKLVGTEAKCWRDKACYFRDIRFDLSPNFDSQADLVNCDLRVAMCDYRDSFIADIKDLLDVLLQRGIVKETRSNKPA